MLANWVEASGNGGAGTQTLTAIAGRPNFNAWFGASGGSQAVYYEIDDGSDTAAPSNNEWGIGTFTPGAGNTATLSRDIVRGTNANGVVTKVGAVALTFGASVRVKISPLAELAVPTLPGVNTADVGSTVGVTTSLTYNDQAFSAAAQTVGRITYVPFWWGGSFPISSAGVSVSTVSAGGNVRAALYSLGTDFRPDKLLLDTGDLSTAVSGLQMASAASWAAPSGQSGLWLPPGWYYSAFQADNATATISTSLQAGVNPLGANLSNRNTRYMYRGVVTYGAFAAQAQNNGSGSYTIINNTSFPILFLGP